MEASLLGDDVLRSMFAELAESVEVPAGGAESALSAVRADRLAPPVSMEEARARRRKRLGAAVGVAAAVAIVGGIVAAGGGGHAKQPAGSASSASGLAAAAAPPAAAPAVTAAAAAVGEGAASADGAVPAAGSAAAAGLGPQAASLNGLSVRGSTTGAAAAPAALPSATAAAAGGVPSVDADRVIRTGDVNLTVPKGSVPATVGKLEGASTGLGGYLQDSSTQQADPKSGGVPTASVTLRVPATAFETLLARVQALGTVVTSTTSGKDVTAQYVDLAARLKALETSRDTYLTILSTAKNVNDTLSVQQRLDGIQSQIEQLQGQQNELGAQSDLATLTVEVSEPAPKPAPAPAAPKARSGLSAAFHTAGDRFRRGSESVIAALGTIALLLLAAIALLVAGRLGHRAYLRRTV